MRETVITYSVTKRPPIGEGGMGVVIHAKHCFLKRDAAIKEILTESFSDPELAERFRREAIYAASLHHPNIITIYDYWETKRTMQMVMEYIDGTTLRGLLTQSSSLSPQISACIIYHIGQALAYIHKRGLVHRDIKPSNVLLSKEGEVKVSDFGIVKDTLHPSDLTRTGAQVGTSTYMSPEQIEGKKELKSTSDIFGLGIILYEMLTGIHPFKSHSSEASAVNISKGRYSPIRKIKKDIPLTLSRIVKKCLKVNPNSRYKDGSAFLKALRWYLWKYDLSLSEKLIKDFLSQFFPDEDKTVVKREEKDKEKKPLKSLRKSIEWKLLMFLVFPLVLFALIAVVLLIFL